MKTFTSAFASESTTACEQGNSRAGNWAVVSRGGHSTVHVMAGSQEEMAPIATALQAVGADPHSGFVPPMLTVDVPPQCSLDAVLEVLTAAESATCAYSVANRQHRTPKADREDA